MLTTLGLTDHSGLSVAHHLTDHSGQPVDEIVDLLIVGGLRASPRFPDGLHDRQHSRPASVTARADPKVS